MPALLWMIHLDAPQEFWDLIEGKDLSNTEGMLDELIYSHRKGWISILGCTDKNADDISSILQEHFSVDVVRPGPIDGSEISTRGRTSNKGRRARLR